MLFSIRTALRSLRTDPISTLLGVLGLAAAVLVFSLALLFAVREHGVGHEGLDPELTYRVNYETTDIGRNWAISVFNETDPVIQDHAGVRLRVRLTTIPEGFLGKPVLIQAGDTQAYESNAVVYADREVMDVFGLRFMEGSPSTSLSAPGHVVVSDRAAMKYFGSLDVVGKSIRIGPRLQPIVSGVFAYNPVSHLQQDFLMVPPNGSDMTPSEDVAFFGWMYVVMTSELDAIDLERRLNDTVEEGSSKRFTLERVTDVYLHSTAEWQLSDLGNPTVSLVLLALGVLLLVVAGGNMASLFVSRYMVRLKGVGIRKVLGANDRSILADVAMEALLLMTLTGTVVAVALVAVHPAFEQWIGVTVPFHASVVWLPTLLLVAFLVVLCTVPLMASRRNAAALLRTSTTGLFSRSFFSRATLALQLAMAVILVASTLMISKQVRFLSEKDLGFNPENVLVLSVFGDDIRSRPMVVQDEISAIPGVKAVSLMNFVPGLGKANVPTIHLAGRASEAFEIPTFVVDDRIVDVLQLRMVSGRPFSRERPGDVGHAFLLNEAAAARLGVQQTGDAVVSGMQSGEVVGIVEDFHWRSLHDAIGPVSMEFHDFEQGGRFVSNIALRVSDGAMSDVISRLESSWSDWDSEHPILYYRLADRIAVQYDEDAALARVARVIGWVGLGVALIGLYAALMRAFLARRREMCLRIVLGARFHHLSWALSTDFTTAIVLGLLSSAPVSVLLLVAWLRSFSYASDGVVGVALLAVGAVLGVSTVVFIVQAARSTHLNPATVLRGD